MKIIQIQVRAFVHGKLVKSFLEKVNPVPKIKDRKTQPTNLFGKPEPVEHHRTNNTFIGKGKVAPVEITQEVGK